MKSPILRILFIAVVIASLNSCQKDDPKPVCYLASIETIYGGPISSVKEELKYENNVLISSGAKTFEYDDKGRMVKYVIKGLFNTETHNFTYEDDEIVKQEWFDTNERMIGKETYQYTNHRLVKLQNWFLDTNDNTWKEGNYTDYEYVDDSYNVSKTTFTNPFWSTDGYHLTTEYKYGPQNAGTSAVPPAIKKWYRLMNYPTDKIIFTIIVADIEITTISGRTNEHLLPVTQTETQSTGAIIRKEFTYTCQ